MYMCGGRLDAASPQGKGRMQITTGSVVDRYTVEGPLGEGGMAMVYRVRHNQLGTYHALKVLTIASTQIAQRLIQEGRVQATLRHPNIVAVTDIVDMSGSPGLIMELINGPSLDDFLVKEQLSIEQVDSLASGILSGVAAAHAQDLIHRDLKPANIMLAITPNGLVPKVTDFGLAKILGGGGGFSNTRTGSTMGTPHYMSPEQIRDSKNVGPRADVFSLGAILYEMVTGRRAFEGDDLLAIFNAVANGDYTPIRQLRPDVTERMERAIDGAMKVALNERIASVAELLAVWGGDAAAVPMASSGPWDAAVLAKASSMSVSGATSSLSDPLSSPTTGAGPPKAPPTTPAVDAMPPIPDSAELDISLVSTPSTSDSLVNARSLMIGVGGSAAIFGALTLFVVFVGLAGFFFVKSSSFMSTAAPEPAGMQEPAPATDPAVEAPFDGAEKGVPAPAHRQRQKPSVVEAPTPTEDPGERADVAGELPEEPVAGEEGAATDADVEDADPAVVDVEDPAVADVEDPDPAVADVEDPGEEMVEDLPEEAPLEDLPIEAVEPGDPRAKLPPDLRSQSTSVRMDGLSMRESQSDTTWIYDIVVRHDPHSELRKKAWRIIQNRWRKGIGPKSEHQAIAVWMLGTGTADQRIEAIDSVARSGSDINLLKASLADSRSSVRRAAIDGIASMARRTGQADPARIMLHELKKTETDSKAMKKIEAALAAI